MNLQKVANDILWKAKENSPYILFAVGVVAMVGTVVEAIHATTKLEELVDERNNQLDKANEFFDSRVEDAKAESLDIVPIEDERKQAIRKVNGKFVWGCVKLYAPTAGLFFTAVGGFGGSVYILHGRYVGATATVTALTKAFDSYRDRVRAEENGEVKDYAYLHGLDLEERTVEEIDAETGKKKKRKELVAVGKPSGLYSYRFERYDPRNEIGSTEWESAGSVCSLPYILGVIQHRQNQLEIGKRVWLVDILEDLGFGQNVAQAGDRFAGWQPGDIILCGLEDVGDGVACPLPQDVTDYLYGSTPDVTLTFNPRPNMYAEVYGQHPVDSDEDDISDVEFVEVA